jgi:mRNA-degrading endonuclease RelE of RelBE toxin-antitoxin system
MKVDYSKAFKKDISKLRNQSLKQKLKKVILRLENEESLRTIPYCIKVQNHSTAYRIRIGDYRLGVYYKNNKIQIARFANRNDIYKLFP